MSNEWAHDAARREVPTVMTKLIDVGRVLTETHALAGSTGATYRRGAVTAQLVQDRSGTVAPAQLVACEKPVVARPKTFQKNPFMTRGAVISGTDSGPHRAWDPV
jgi:hypothetical protein